MQKIVVKYLKENSNLVKLNKYILKMFPSLPFSSLYKAIRNKDIKVNGVRVNKDIYVKNNDIIEIYINDNILFNIQKHINYIYEDQNILVAYKNQGMLSNNEDKSKKNNEVTFEDLVKKDKNDIENALHICHRLDRNTAGLLIFSKNDTAYHELFDAFKLGYIEKEYIAYVANCNFKQDKDTLTSFILENNKTGIAKVYESEVKNSKKIITSYQVIKKFQNRDFAKIQVQIHTGKMHQIRCQLAYVNHPIIGDSKYGKNSINRKFGIYKQLLFAYKFSFNFPQNYSLNYLNDKNFETEIPDYASKLNGDEKHERTNFN